MSDGRSSVITSVGPGYEGLGDSRVLVRRGTVKTLAEYYAGGGQSAAQEQVLAAKGGESDGSSLTDTPRVVERQQSLNRQYSGLQVGTVRGSWEETVKEAPPGKPFANGHAALHQQAAVVTEIDLELATERDSAAQQLADVQRLADERAARIVALQWQLVASRGAQQQHEARAAELEQQLAGERRNRSRQLAEMQRYAAEQAAKIAALEAQLAARQEEEQGAQQAAGVAELEQQLADAQHLAAEQAARVAELEQQLAEEQQAAANLILDAQQEAAEHAAKLALLEGQLGAAKEEYEAQNAALAEQLQQANAAVDEQRQRISELEKELSEGGQGEEYLAQNAALAALVQQANATVAEQKRQISDLEAQLSAAVQLGMAAAAAQRSMAAAAQSAGQLQHKPKPKVIYEDDHNQVSLSCCVPRQIRSVDRADSGARGEASVARQEPQEPAVKGEAELPAAKQEIVVPTAKQEIVVLAAKHASQPASEQEVTQEEDGTQHGGSTITSVSRASSSMSRASSATAEELQEKLEELEEVAEDSKTALAKLQVEHTTAVKELGRFRSESALQVHNLQRLKSECQKLRLQRQEQAAEARALRQELATLRGLLESADKGLKSRLNGMLHKVGH